MISTLSRRSFLRGSAVATVGLPFALKLAGATSQAAPQVETVTGPIPAEQLGFTLVHEHILCDFIGADKTGPGRWDADEVARVILPYLRPLRDRQVRSLVDCTPAYIGRDPRLLRRLARETGLRILTNTGYYGAAGDKYVPTHAYLESAEELADRWVREAQHGIEGTDIRPGFIKTGVDAAVGDPPRLSEIDAKLVRAAALASRRAGLAVACHTSGGPSALAALELFVKSGGDAGRFIVAHADGHGTTLQTQLAQRGAWLSLDGLGGQATQAHLDYVLPLLDRHPERVLLSMDAGWYWAGEAGGGKVRDYNYLTDTFLPALRRSGVSEARLRQVTAENPAHAFARGPSPAR